MDNIHSKVGPVIEYDLVDKDETDMETQYAALFC